MFKYLDLVKVVKPEPRPGEVVILNPEAVNDAMAFFIGAVGRVIDRIPGGYRVWFPVPCFPEKGKFMEFSERSLKLFHGATEKDYRAAHYPGVSATVPMPPLEAPKSSGAFKVAVPDEAFRDLEERSQDAKAG